MRYYATHPPLEARGFALYATVLGKETRFNTTWWLIRPESVYARSATQTLMDMYTSSGQAVRARWVRCSDVHGSASSEVKVEDLLWVRKATGKVYTQQSALKAAGVSSSLPSIPEATTVPTNSVTAYKSPAARFGSSPDPAVTRSVERPLPDVLRRWKPIAPKEAALLKPSSSPTTSYEQVALQAPLRKRPSRERPPTLANPPYSKEAAPKHQNIVISHNKLQHRRDSIVRTQLPVIGPSHNRLVKRPPRKKKRSWNCFGS